MYDNDTLGTELRHRMLAVDVPPGGADVHRAIADGRHANRRRAGLLTAAAAGVTVLAMAGAFAVLRPMPDRVPAIPPPASPATGCRPTPLPTPSPARDGHPTRLSAMDPAGRIFAGNTGDQPVRWTDGEPETLAGVRGEAVDVAADGAVLGTDGDDLWVWRDGQVTHLERLAGHRDAVGLAINAKGQVAGYAAGATLSDTVPVIWSADGAVHRLTMPAGAGAGGGRPAMARDIADDGTVVGDVFGVPMRWSPAGAPGPLRGPTRT
ncbi:hypothetical protein ABT369_17205 [Dactylosporangium sp. NPDC000244]|uniref:hypothetical protein n=1 Tax=Dactylosporangium sp. NPDC000244 TaxID=3154365 RepID=UPI00333097E5